MEYVELNRRDDDRLIPWLALYETAFPATERVLISGIISLLKRKEEGHGTDERLLAVLDDRNELVGIGYYEILDQAAGLWYMAVTPELRNRGIGSSTYQYILRCLRDSGVDVAVFEVERPEDALSEEDRHIAERRIRFYLRQGAQLLNGIRYMQHVGDHMAPIPMHIMIHSLGAKALGPQAAFLMSKAIFEDALTQIGELQLESRFDAVPH